MRNLEQITITQNKNFNIIDFFFFFFRQDSLVNDEVTYDLLKTIDGIQNGSIPCPELIIPSLVSKTQESIPSAMEKVYCGEVNNCCDS